jgi:hypothetical protein
MSFTAIFPSIGYALIHRKFFLYFLIFIAARKGNIFLGLLQNVWKVQGRETGDNFHTVSSENRDNFISFWTNWSKPHVCITVCSVLAVKHSHICLISNINVVISPGVKSHRAMSIEKAHRNSRLSTPVFY